MLKFLIDKSNLVDYVGHGKITMIGIIPMRCFCFAGPFAIACLMIGSVVDREFQPVEPALNQTNSTGVQQELDAKVGIATGVSLLAGIIQACLFYDIAAFLNDSEKSVMKLGFLGLPSLTWGTWPCGFYSTGPGSIRK